MPLNTLPMSPSRRNVRLVVLALLAWGGLVVCRVAARLVSVGSGARGPLGLLLLTASVNAYWIVAGPALVWWRSRITARHGAFVRHTLVALSCVAVVCAEPLWYHFILTAFHGTPLDWSSAVVQRGDVNVLLVVLIVAAASVRDSHRHATIRQRQRDELEATLVDAELRALTLQLQPHFLFNTLQLAAEAAFDDLDAAKRIVRELQTLLQRTFVFEERSLVRVADEVDFLQSYIAIQQQRFGSRLSVDVQVDPAAYEFLIPPLLLQPLVENSIQHGLGPLARDGRIVVSVLVDGDRIRLAVRDNGIGFAAGERAASSSGLGLGVTRRRLTALYPNQHSIETRVAAEGGACVEISIPVQGVNAGETAATSAPEPSRLSGHHQLAPVRWRLRALAAVATAASLVIANVIVSEILLHPSAPMPRAGLIPVTAAMWIPAQVVALALVVVLWRARVVRTWLRVRDRETRHLRAQIDSARARAAPLRVGKDLMLATLGQLLVAVSAVEFDQMIISSSERIRSLLAFAEDGHSSIDLEAELVRR